MNMNMTMNMYTERTIERYTEREQSNYLLCNLPQHLPLRLYEQKQNIKEGGGGGGGGEDG